MRSNDAATIRCFSATDQRRRTLHRRNDLDTCVVSIGVHRRFNGSPSHLEPQRRKIMRRRTVALTITVLLTGPTSDGNAAAISIDLQAGTAGGTAAQGIFLKSTTGGTSGKIVNYVDSTGVTIFALLADGSLLLSPLADLPAGTTAGLKLCNVGGTLGVVDSTGTFTPLT
jgi:hypothetical protein